MQKEQKSLISSQEQNIITSALILGYNDFYIKSKQNKNDKTNPFNVMVYLSSKASTRPVPAKAVPYVVVNKNSVNQFYFNEFVRGWAKNVYNYMTKINSLNAKTCFQGVLKETLYDVYNDYKTKDLTEKLANNLLKIDHIVDVTDLTYMLANQQKVCKIFDDNHADNLTNFLRNQEIKYFKKDRFNDLREKSKVISKNLGKGQIINNKLCYNNEIIKELNKVNSGVSNFENK